MKKAIVIGASSGMGRELALILSKNGYEVGIMARRMDLLETLQKEMPSKFHVGHIDLNNTSESIEKFEKMIQTLRGLDLFVINAGVGFLNPELDWEKEKQTIDVNVTGFCVLAGMAFKFFSQQNRGHLVGISSIGALRGNFIAPAYNASKSFMSNYLEGLGKKAFKDNLSITVTDIIPGFVDTSMAKGEGKFWVAPTQKAAEQIYSAIKNKRRQAYVTRRWRLIGWLFKLMPNWIYNRIM